MEAALGPRAARRGCAVLPTPVSNLAACTATGEMVYRLSLMTWASQGPGPSPADCSLTADTASAFAVVQGAEGEALPVSSSPAESDLRSVVSSRRTQRQLPWMC